MSKVSIIVPVYNAEARLSECINSLINQTYKDIEIILVNDGSTDLSANICNDYRQRDIRIKVYHQKNSGASAARNYGLQMVTGEYITFVDADDCINSQFIESLVEEIEKHESDMVVSAMVDIFNPSNQLVNRQINVNQLTGILAKDYKYLADLLRGPVAKLYKSTIIKDHSIIFPEDYIVSEDRIFNFLYFKYVTYVSYTNKAIYTYIHDNKDSLSTLVTSESYACDLRRLEVEKDFFYSGDILESDTILVNDGINLIDKYIYIQEGINHYKDVKERILSIFNIIKNCQPVLTRNRKVIFTLLKLGMIKPIYWYYMRKYNKRSI